MPIQRYGAQNLHSCDRLRRFYCKSRTAVVLAIMMQRFLCTSFPAHRTILLA
jgi:hypothetical protein